MSSGSWVPHHTCEPYDWRSSIRYKRWKMEIARATRAIADSERHPVTVMWLIGTDSRVAQHDVLPWFHSRSELDATPKAAPRRKLRSARDFQIASKKDWGEFKDAISSGRRVERVVVAPEDPELIRNAKFAEELADLTARSGSVVELAGSILSHAYYVLRRRGAQVECVDLFGADADVIEFNKLVRDKIPESIEQKGERVEIVRLTGDALVSGLRQKLVEEAFEVLDARGRQEVVGELADVQDVVRAICDALGLSLKAVEAEGSAKRREKGGFGRGVMLRRTTTPGTLNTGPSYGGEELFGKAADENLVAVGRTDQVPSKSLYRRPDLRNIAEQPEKIILFEVELNRVPSRKQLTRFTMPVPPTSDCDFFLELEFSRVREVLRGVVRLRLQPIQLRKSPDSQLLLDFGEESADEE